MKNTIYCSVLIALFLVFGLQFAISQSTTYNVSSLQMKNNAHDSSLLVDTISQNKPKSFWSDIGGLGIISFRKGIYGGALSNNLKGNNNLEVGCIFYKKRLAVNFICGIGQGKLNNSILADGLVWSEKNTNYYFELSTGYSIVDNKRLMLAPYIGINTSLIDSGCIESIQVDGSYVCIESPLISISKTSPIIGINLNVKLYNQNDRLFCLFLRSGVIPQKFNDKYDFLENGYEGIFSVGLSFGGK